MGDGLRDLTEVLRTQGASLPKAVPQDRGSPGRTHVFVLEDIVVKCDDRLRSLSMVREASALELLVGTGLPVPRLLNAGQFSDSRRWVVLERLPGRPPEDARRPAHELSAGLAAQLGALIARLHQAVSPPAFGTWANGGGRSLMDEVRDRTARLVQLGHKEAIVPPSEIDRLAEMLAELMPSLEVEAPPVLAHRDVQPRNVLVDGDQVTALLDFESSAGGDPAEDFSAIGLDWASPAFSAFAQAYADAGGMLGPDGPDRVTHHVLWWALVIYAYLGRIAPGYLPAARLALERAAAGDRPSLPPARPASPAVARGAADP